MNDTDHIDIEDDDLDNSYAEYSKRSASFSIFILIIFIIIGIRLLSHTPASTISITTENYQMECTIVSVTREAEKCSMLVEGYHGDELEQHIVNITKQEFMTYKEGQTVTLDVSTSNQCRVVK